MTMQTTASALALVTTLAGDLALLLAGLRGLRRPGELPAVLRRHRLLPSVLRGRVATALLEACFVLAGSAGVVFTVTGAAAGTRIAAACTAAIYLAFSGYLGVLWRVRGRVPCGCLGSEAPMTAWSVGRGLGVALAGVAVSVLPTTRLALQGRLLAVAVAAFCAAMLMSLALLRPRAGVGPLSASATQQPPPHRPSAQRATSTPHAGRAR